MTHRIHAWLRSEGFYAAMFLFVLVLVFTGRVLLPGEGMALSGHDIRSQFLPWLSGVNEAVRAGRLPLWDSYHFSGYPFLSNPQIAFFYPPTWLALVLPPRVAISWYVAFHLWLAGLGMFFFVRATAHARLGALLAAISFSYSGFFVARIWAGHISFIAAIAWLPWLMFLTAWAIRRDDFGSKALSGLPLGLIILTGHFASLLYVGLIWACFTLWLAISSRCWWRVFQTLIGSSLIGLGLGAVQLLPFVQLSRLSARVADQSFEFATRFSLPPAHLFALLIPDVYGEPTRIGYWGAEAFQELTYYAGALGLLGVLVALRKPSRRAILYLGLLAAGLLLALGSTAPFYEPIFRALPPLRLVRAPARFALLYTFSASALVGELISSHFRPPGAEPRPELRKWLRIFLVAIAVTGAVSLAIMATRYQSLPPSDAANRLRYQMGGAARAFTVLFFGAVLLIGYLKPERASRPRNWLFALALVGLILVDLWHFGWKQMSLSGVGPHPLWTDARAIIGESNARVLPWGVPIFDQNGAGEVNLRSVFGYNPIELQAPIALAASLPDPRANAYDVLAVEHVIAPVPQEQYTGGDRPLTLVGNTESVWVYRRDRTLPMVRLVGRAVIIPDPARALARLNEPDFDPQTTVILDRPHACDLTSPPESASSASLVVSGEEYWEITTSSPSPALLVLSQAAYPGWQVRINGQKAEPLVAYTALLAVCVPAGDHTVTWTYRPTIFVVGFSLTLATALAVALAATLTRKRTVDAE